MGKLESRHFIKIPILWFLSLLTFMLKSEDLVFVGVFVILVRYSIEYLIQFVLTGSINRIPIRFYHTFSGYFILTLFGQFFIRILG